MASDVIADTPAWKTQILAKLEDLREWVAQNKHISEKQIAMLESMSGGQRAMRKAPLTQAVVADTVYAEKMKPNFAAPHVLLAPPKRAPFEVLERTIVTLVRQAMLSGGSIKITNANSLNWKSLRAAERGGAYAWVARNFDACAVVENSSDCLGRGVFDIASAFIVAGKMVGVPRELTLGWYIVPCSITTFDESDWKQRYGRCVVSPDLRVPIVGEFCTERVNGSGCGAPMFDYADVDKGVRCELGHAKARAPVAGTNGIAHELDLDDPQEAW